MIGRSFSYHAEIFFNGRGARPYLAKQIKNELVRFVPRLMVALLDGDCLLRSDVIASAGCFFFKSTCCQGRKALETSNVNLLEETPVLEDLLECSSLALTLISHISSS